MYKEIMKIEINDWEKEGVEKKHVGQREGLKQGRISHFDDEDSDDDDD